MIIIRSDHHGVTVQGHATPAGHIPSKEDVEACAAITALSHQLIGGILQLTPRSDPVYELDHGLMTLSTDGLTQRARFLVQAFVVGCLMVMEGYPDQVMVIDETET